jgi:hypothetical protein
MVNAGVPDVALLGDGWTVVTVDHSLSAYFEHSVAITAEGPEILTTVKQSAHGRIPTPLAGEAGHFPPPLAGEGQGGGS